MKKEKYDNNLIISVEGINNINYIKTLEIYINSILILSQDIKVLDDQKKKL